MRIASPAPHPHRLIGTPRYARRCLAVCGSAVVLLGLLTPMTGGFTAEASVSAYDSAIMRDAPVAYWPVDKLGTDLSGHGHIGTFHGGVPPTVTLPNGDSASDFNGAGQFMSVPSSAAFSVPTTRQLTWEGWIRPDTLQFPHSTGGYVDWLGKCQDYSPTCEWEARIYNQSNPEGRTSRVSAYIFNRSAGLGSAADWQPAGEPFVAGGWIHVVGEYRTDVTPSGCFTAYPGSINVWVDGVKQNFAYHSPTGCMSQYSVIPMAASSPLNIGAVSSDSYFKGAVGKVAIYDHLLTPSQIDAHYTAMTGTAPSGSCANTCTLASQPGGSPAAGAVNLAATPTQPMSVSSAPTPNAGSTTQAGTVSATYVKTSSWPNGYCAAVTIKASGVVVKSWSARMTISGHATSGWNAAWSQSGTMLSMRNVSWNGTIFPTKPLKGVGFCAATR